MSPDDSTSADRPFSAHSADPFTIEGWQVDPAACRLERDDEVIRLEPKVLSVLVVLARHAGSVVPRETLHERVWPDVIVNDNALTRCISDLRRAFDDDPRDPRVIETIPKVGYRLIAPVKPVAPRTDVAAAEAEGASGEGGASTRLAEGGDARSVPVGLVLLGIVVTVIGIVIGMVFAFNHRPELLRAEAPRPLTTAPGEELTPALSPEGTHVAYARPGDGLFVRVIDAETPLQVTRGPDAFPSWSPDGSAIAFLRCPEQVCRPFTVSSVGTDERPVADVRARPMGLAWSPDGTTVALADTAHAGLVLLDLDTHQRRILTAPVAGMQVDGYPTFSPDGTHLAFVRLNGPHNGDVYVVELETGRLTRITEDDAHVWSVAWMPDGASLLIVSNRRGPYGLWQAPVDGEGTLHAVPLSARDPGPLAAARSSSRLVFADYAYDVDLWRLDLQTGTSEPVAFNSTWWDKEPHVASDGRMAFVSNRTGTPEVWVAEEGVPRRLTRFGEGTVYSPRWSPDGTRLAFAARSGSHADLYVTTPDASTPRRMTTADADDLNPRWSRDGRHLYFASNRTGQWQIWRVALDGEAPVQVTEEGGFVAMEGPSERDS
ncbi:MAG: hypothetical protein GVY18_11090, partial [Bacteroidetes bacterium]|nr:hypothetical protein [Bacteroidota bacterium]